MGIISDALGRGCFHIDIWQQLEVISVGVINVPSIVFWVEALGYHF